MDGLRRRTLLHGTVTASALVLAGCTSEYRPAENATNNPESEGEDTASEKDTPDGENDADPEDSESGPEATVRTFFEVLDSGDAERINAVIAADSPVGEIDEQSAKEMQENALRLQSIEETEREGDEASVEVRVTSENVESWGEGPQPFIVEVRQRDGEWLVWDMHPPGAGRSAPNAPQIAVETDIEDGTLVITHEGGDMVPADQLYVRGDGLGTTGSWAALDGETSAESDGSPAVAAGDSVRVDIENRYTLRLVWEDGEDSVVVAEHAGAYESESVSAPPAPVREYLADTDNFDGTITDLTETEQVRIGAGEIPGVDQMMAFSPPAVRVSPGTEIVWELVGGGAHSITATEGAFDSGVFDGEGATFSYTVEEEGVVLYHCEPHQALGMKGALLVEPESSE